MACSRLTAKAQEAALFAVSFAFAASLNMMLFFWFLFLSRDNLLEVFQ